MRVGLLTTGFPRFEGDCSGSFLLTLARGLAAHGHEVRVLAPEPAELREPPEWPGIEVRWVRYAWPKRLQRTFYDSGAPENLERAPTKWLGAATFSTALLVGARRELADCDALVSSWSIPCGLVASSIAGKRTHLCICHATDVRWLSKLPGHRLIARQIAKGVTSMWFLSRTLRDQFFATAGLDPSSIGVHVGPMPIDAPIHLGEPRAELRRRLGIEGFTLLFLGRLVPVKGLDQLLLAVSQLPDPVSLRIAGDGPERRRLLEQVRVLGIDARFEGWVAGRRKEALLRACDAIVVPSRAKDGLPTVLFEAKARRLPIITTATGAIAEHIHGEPDAVVVPVDDVAALGRAIDRLRVQTVGARAATG